VKSHLPGAAKALLFFSGLAALVYQTIWIKQLTLVVGVDVYAITTGVSAFFAGLAIGSAVFGRIADRTPSPLRMYAWLELGIAALGIGSTLALASVPPLFVATQSQAGLLAWTIPFVLVATPAALMGGTLPLLLAALHPPEDGIGRVSGQLYAANTAGAIAGALLTVFAIVPAFGIRGASFSAATLNLVLAGAALMLAARLVGAAPELADSGDDAPARMEPDARLAVGLYALAGGVALGYEVVWTQVIVQFLSTRAIAFAVVLATYLTGLVIGSWTFSRFADRIQRRWDAFGLLIAGAGIAALATFAILGPWLPEAQESLGRAIFEVTGSRMAMMLSRFALAAGVLVLPPTLLLGAAFPAVARLTVQPESVGGDVGIVLALNTALGIAGSVVTGFVLVPAFGLAGSLAALAFVAAGAAWGQADGQIIFLLILSVAAAEVAVGLSLVLQIQRRFRTLDMDRANRLRG
jgi:NADH:ubiquinone oxidoreductase subunit K